MANGEGFKVTLVLIAGFVAMALFGLIMIATGKADVKVLLEFYVGLGTLAKLFGIDSAIQTWLTTRNETALAKA